VVLVGCWLSAAWSWPGSGWVLAPNLPRLGRLPGDIVIERANGRFYFPIVTCILISVLLSLMTCLIRAVMR
jgi:Protein of unknown function (DUF2905)